jgi:hypothetical protein
MTTPIISIPEMLVTNSVSTPTISNLSDGGYVVFWSGADPTPPNGSTIIAQRFDSNGDRVGTEVPMPHTGVYTSLFRYEPVATSSPSSSTVGVVYGETHQGLFSDRPSSIEVATFDPASGAWSSGREIISDGDDDDISFFDWSITAFANGSTAVSYTFDESYPDVGRWIVGRTSTQFDIHHEEDLAGNSELATLSNGNFVAVYEDQFNGGANDIRYRIFTPAGTAATASTVVPGAGDGSTNESTPHVAGLHGGGFVVVWSDTAGDADGQGVRATILDNAGNSVVADFQVNTSTAGTQAAADVLALADGGFLVTWSDDGAGALRAQRFDLLGHTMGDEFIVRGAPGSTEAALLQDGRFAYVTHIGGNVMTSVWDPRGHMGALGDVLWRHDGGSAATGVRDLGWVDNTWDMRGAGDFDGDGDGDILWHHAGGQVTVWEMQQGAYVVNHNQPFAGATWQTAGTGDFDGDGDSDILWRHDDGQLLTWEMEAGSYVVNHNLDVVPTAWQIAGTGDFDGDGDDDILWRHESGQVVTWEMQGGAYVVNHNFDIIPTTWQIAGAGDFDGDGDDDILWHHDDGQVVTWEMQDGAYVVNHNIAVGTALWRINGTGDFDRDGDDDILWRHDDGQLVTWEMEAGSYVVNHNLGVVTTDWQIRGTGEFDV